MAGRLLLKRTLPASRFVESRCAFRSSALYAQSCIGPTNSLFLSIAVSSSSRSFDLCALGSRCFSVAAVCSAPGAPHAGGRGAAPSRARLTDEEDLRLGVMGDEEVGAERSVEYGKGSPLVRGADNRHGRADLHAARNPAAVVRGNVSPKAAATPVLPSAAAAAPQSGGSGPRAGSPRPAGASAGSAALPGSLGEREDEARARDEDEYAAGPAADDDDEEEDQDEDEDADQDQFGFDDEVESDEDEDEDAAGRGASAAEAPKKVKGGKDKSTSSRLSADARPIANSAIRVPQLRVVDASAGSNVNLGVMPTGQALALAREKRVDLVLVNATAVPPVARLIALHKLLAAAKEAEAERRKASKKSQPKEVRLTSRISPHDLDVKGARIVSFLRDGRPVRLSVSYTLSAWMQEEPARREVLATLARRLAESGAGTIDAGSIRGEGASLHAQANPCAPAKAASELAKVLSKLAAPIGSPAESDERLRRIQATAAAAMAGQASAATIESVLPPPGVMRAFRTKRAKGLSGSAGEDEDKRDARDGRAAALDVGGADDERDTGDFGLGDVSAGGFRPKGRSKKGGRR